MPREMRSYKCVRSPRSNEFDNIDELEKQEMRDEPGRITNTYKEDDDEKLVSKGLKSDNDEVIKNGSESNADPDADGVTGVIQIKSPNIMKLKLFKEADDENLVSKRFKSNNDEDIKNGSESNADSDADGVTGVIQIKSPNVMKLKLFKEADDENLVSKRFKSNNDEDIKNGSESNADSDADGVIQIKSPNVMKLKLFQEADDENLVSKKFKSNNDEDTKNGSESNADSDSDGTGVIQIESLNRKKLLLQRLSSLNAFIADTSEPVLLSSTHEWEQVEKEPQQQDCQNLHTQGDTEQANSDLATNLAEKAITTKEENEKSEQEMVKVNVQITQ